MGNIQRCVALSMRRRVTPSTLSSARMFLNAGWNSRKNVTLSRLRCITIMSTKYTTIMSNPSISTGRGLLKKGIQRTRMRKLTLWAKKKQVWRRLKV